MDNDRNLRISVLHMYLLWRNLKSLTSHVDLLVDVHTGDDKEDPRTPGSSRKKPTQSEDDCPLVLLDHLHHEDEAEGEGGHDQHQGEDGEGHGADAGSLLAG